MRKFLLFTLTAFVVVSCKQIQQAPYTSITNILKLKQKDPITQVIAKLGIEPYALYASTSGGYTVYTWYYKKLDRLENPKRINSPGSENTGKQKYDGKLNQLYIVFDENNAMVGMYTDSGRKDGAKLAIDHHILTNLEKNGACTTCREDSLKAPDNSKSDEAPALPFLKKK